jgi:hypothetical protein
VASTGVHPRLMPGGPIHGSNPVRLGTVNGERLAGQCGVPDRPVPDSPKSRTHRPEFLSI